MSGVRTHVSTQPPTISFSRATSNPPVQRMASRRPAGGAPLWLGCSAPYSRAASKAIADRHVLRAASATACRAIAKRTLVTHPAVPTAVSALALRGERRAGDRRPVFRTHGFARRTTCWNGRGLLFIHDLPPRRSARRCIEAASHAGSNSGAPSGRSMSFARVQRTRSAFVTRSFFSAAAARPAKIPQPWSRQISGCVPLHRLPSWQTTPAGCFVFRVVMAFPPASLSLSRRADPPAAAAGRKAGRR